ncbi:MAG: hypothetical protein ACKOXW_06195, partial [Actinomycetes bacterium]
EVPSMDISDNDIKARALSGTFFLSGVQPLDGARSHLRCRLVDSDVHGMLVILLITIFNRNHLVTLAAFVLSMVLGWVQFQWIERPIRDGFRLPRVSFGRLVAGFVVIALLVYGSMSVITPAIGKYVAGREPEEISMHIIEKPCEG